MAGERRLYFGSDATDARYLLEDPGPDGDLVVKDTDNADREVFRYDGTDDLFELRDATATSFDTEELNNIKFVKAGESIQTVLDGLSRPSGAVATVSNAIVVLEADATFNEKITIPNYTSVMMNGAYIEPESDGDAVELGGPGAELWGPGYILTGVGYSHTGANIKLDSSNFSTDLHPDNFNTVRVCNQIGLANPANHAGNKLLHVVADGNAVTIGNRFDVICRRGDEQVVFEVNNGAFVNGTELNVASWPTGASEVLVHRSTAGTAGAARVLTNGAIQTTGSVTHVISNETSVQPSYHFSGQIYDTANASASALNGPGIKTYQTRLRPDAITFGNGTTVNKVGHQPLAGAAPDATNYELGDVVLDTDNLGDLYFIYDNTVSGGASQIGT